MPFLQVYELAVGFPQIMGKRYLYTQYQTAQMANI